MRAAASSRSGTTARASSISGPSESTRSRRWPPTSVATAARSAGSCDVGSVEVGGAGGRTGAPGPDVELEIPELPDDLASRLQARTRDESPVPPRDLLGEPAARVARGASVGQRIERIERGIRPLEASVRRYKRWRGCVEEVGVSEFGDPDGRFGYVYDEVDGGGVGRRSALGLDENGRADFRLLDFELTRRCRSAPTVPGGTAEDPRTARRCGDQQRAPRGSPATGQAARGAGGPHERDRALSRALRRMGVVSHRDPGDRVRRPGGRLRILLAGGRPLGWVRGCQRSRRQRVGRPRLSAAGLRGSRRPDQGR